MSNKLSFSEVKDLFTNGYRLLGMKYPRAIGHLVQELECYYKECALGFRKKDKLIIICDYRSEIFAPANEHFLTYFSNENIVYVDDPYTSILIENYALKMDYFIDIEHYAMKDWDVAYSGYVMNQWANRPPILQLSSDDYYYGITKLKNLGITENDFFILLHVRQSFNRPQDSNHSHRNSSINNYHLAIEYIRNLGGYVLTIGDPLKDGIDKLGVINYTISNQRSPRMDVFLSAKAKFVIASSSGFCALPGIFGTPLCCANLAPLKAPTPYLKAINLFKKIRNKQSGEILSYENGMKTPISNTNYYDFSVFEYVENTPQEILNLVLDMEVFWNESNELVSKNVQLRRHMKELFSKNDYGYYSESYYSLRNYSN